MMTYIASDNGRPKLRRLDMGVKVMVHGDPAQRPLRLLA